MPACPCGIAVPARPPALARLPPDCRRKPRTSGQRCVWNSAQTGASPGSRALWVPKSPFHHTERCRPGDKAPGLSSGTERVTLTSRAVTLRPPPSTSSLEAEPHGALRPVPGQALQGGSGKARSNLDPLGHTAVSPWARPPPTLRGPGDVGPGGRGAGEGPHRRPSQRRHIGGSCGADP